MATSKHPAQLRSCDSNHLVRKCLKCRKFNSLHIYILKALINGKSAKDSSRTEGVPSEYRIREIQSTLRETGNGLHKVSAASNMNTSRETYFKAAQVDLRMQNMVDICSFVQLGKNIKSSLAFPNPVLKLFLS